MTDDLYAGIDEAKNTAKRLIQRGHAVEEAVRRRDDTLYKLLTQVHRLERQLRKRDWNEVSSALGAKYGSKPLTRSKLALFLLQLVHPTLNSKVRSKYAAVIPFVRKNRKEGSFRGFVKQNGGLNGCARRAAELRKARKTKSASSAARTSVARSS